MNYYKILGVPPNASGEAIRKAYRQLAKEHHPDMHQTSDAKEKHGKLFKKVQEAYDHLSDPNKRHKVTPPRPESKPKPEPKKKEDFVREMDTVVPTEQSFFGNSARGRSVMIRLKLTEKELLEGCKRTIIVKKRDFCGRCGGIGTGIFPCPKCRNHSQVKWACASCNGTGEYDGVCDTCHGDTFGGWVLDHMPIQIPANSKLGDQITMLGKGEGGARKSPGNVVVILI